MAAMILVNSCPARPDERFALRVFIRARRFADEHDLRVGIADAEDGLRARFREVRAQFADLDAAAHFGEPLGFRVAIVSRRRGTRAAAARAPALSARRAASGRRPRESASSRSSTTSRADWKADPCAANDLSFCRMEQFELTAEDAETAEEEENKVPLCALGVPCGRFFLRK